MKTKIFPILMAGLLMSACSFIETDPQGYLDDEKAMKEPNALVTAAYSTMGNDWYQYAFNMWHYGDLSSDDCLKGGSGETDTELHPVEVWSSLTAQSPSNLDELWYRLYWSISRCNRALTSIETYGAEQLGDELAKQRRGEVLFIRAHYYYKLAQLFYQVPWVDEQVTAEASQAKVRNDVFSHEELMLKVIDDFREAYNLLPVSWSDGSFRVTKSAAAAYVAKTYLQIAYGDGYEANTGYSHVNKAYMDSVLVYTAVVANDGQYGYLEDYGDIFLPEHKNSQESVFSVQHSDYADDNTVYGRANWSNMLNGVWGMWSCGWDFQKPSQNFVNAFKVGTDGLPMFDTYDVDHNTYPTMGNVTSQKWDPRLFHTVGMPTYPYKYESDSVIKADGSKMSLLMTTANSRTPATYGYYTTLKCVPQRSKGETFNQPWQAFAMNEYVIRYTEVMLWRAEAMIETGDLGGALTIINDIRTRAKNSVDKHIGYAASQCDIALYPTLGSTDDARRALRWEYRLEMGQEHERYFCLRRWGLASQTLNAYFQSEQNDKYEKQEYAKYLRTAFYTVGKNEYWPIPYNQLYYVPGLYTQNKGY